MRICRTFLKPAILTVCNYREGVGGISGQVDLLTRSLRADGFRVVNFSTRGSLLYRLLTPLLLCRAARRADVVHVHCCSHRGFFPAIVAVPVGRMLRKRVVVTYHGGGAEAFFRRHHRLVSAVLRRSHVNIVLNRFLQQVFESYGLSCVLVPNIIEPVVSAPRHRSALLPRYICTRAHESLYRVDLVLRAFAAVRSQLPDASLLLVGDGSCHADLVALAEHLRLGESVSFVGRVHNVDVPTWLDRADVFVSAAAEDNMPVSVMEAMQRGLLVVASRVGGVPYLVDDGRTGLLFDTEAQLVEAMMAAVNDQACSLNIIEQALCEVAQYSWQSVAPLIYRAYGFTA